jgi:MFS family permease
MPSLFRSLAHADFRLLLAGQVSTSTAQWMEQVTRGWLIYDMTGSVFLLGLVQAARAAPFLLLGPFGGVLADRLDRQRQLMVSQLLNMALHLTLATLIVMGRVEVWHVFATALLAGCVMAFQQPARQSLIPNVVPSGDLANAVALNAVALNLSRSLGPAVAGVLVSVLGTGGAYYFQAGMFLVASLWTLQLGLAGASRRHGRPQESLFGSMREGFVYISGNRTVFSLLLLALLPIVLAQPYTSLLPAFARDVYATGPTGLGLLLGATGVGAALGAFLVAGLGDFRRKGLYLLSVVMLFGVALVAFATTPTLWLAVPVLGVVGFAQTSYRVVDQTLLQSNTRDEFRGRVMSIYLLDRGMAPLGSLLAGTLATFLGAPMAVGLMGAGTFLVAVLVLARVPTLRRLT